jgi:hypothetical protein
MAGAAPLSTQPWLPTYGWWPPPGTYAVRVVLSPYHHSVDPDAEFAFTLRGYCGSSTPAWEHEVGRLGHGEQRVVDIASLDEVPEPPPAGGVLEIDSVRTDEPPQQGRNPYIGMWLDARGPTGGGYLIPTIPIRGAGKTIARDDLQVVPGVMASEQVETELLLLNPVDETIEVRLVASSADGLASEAKPFEVTPWSAFHEDLSRRIPRLRRLLAASGGIGSLAIYSSHRILPYFAFRREGHPIVSMDHPAPIFG